MLSIFFSYVGAVFQKSNARTIRKNRRESVEASKLGQQVNTLKDVLDAREAAGKNMQNSQFKRSFYWQRLSVTVCVLEITAEDDFFVVRLLAHRHCFSHEQSR